MMRNSWANLALILGAVCIVARVYTLERAKDKTKPRLPRWGIVVGEA